MRDKLICWQKSARWRAVETSAPPFFFRRKQKASWNLKGRKKARIDGYKMNYSLVRMESCWCCGKTAWKSSGFFAMGANECTRVWQQRIFLFFSPRNPIAVEPIFWKKGLLSSVSLRDRYSAIAQSLMIKKRFDEIGKIISFSLPSSRERGKKLHFHLLSTEFLSGLNPVN